MFRTTHNLKKNISFILKDLKDEDLNSLEKFSKNENKSEFFENFFDLARIDKAIDRAHQIPSDIEKAYALQDISNTLAKSGNFGKAIEVAHQIPSDDVKGCALWDISKALTKSGDIDRAIEVAKQIYSDTKGGCALWDISKALTKSGDIDRAIEVAEEILINGIQASVPLLDISNALLKNGNINKAIEVAKQIPCDDVKKSALRDIERLLDAGSPSWVACRASSPLPF